MQLSPWQQYTQACTRDAAALLPELIKGWKSVAASCDSMQVWLGRGGKSVESLGHCSGFLRAGCDGNPAGTADRTITAPVLLV